VTCLLPLYRMGPMTGAVKKLFLKHRFPDDTRSSGPPNAAVLVPLFEYLNRLWVILIRRSETFGLHRGQMGFPGGMSEDSDGGDSLRTALRETEEEIGLAPCDVEIAGTLSIRPTLKTGLKVQPFVGLIPWPYRFSPDPLEIRSVHYAPLADLAGSVMGEGNDYGLIPPVYPVDGFPVWGLTGRIVAELLEVLDPMIGDL